MKRLPRMRPVPPRTLIEILEKAGFRVIRQRGSHVILMNEERVRIVVMSTGRRT
ncbi:MAG: type II toxin-antitoxin system HicA family toxin [Candidatus Korarchaeota archaeon]|nr:type II toxin-antitoxin system HicA family toxin [Candidatus Korarchaeota archaeon]